MKRLLRIGIAMFLATAAMGLHADQHVSVDEEPDGIEGFELADGNRREMRQRFSDHRLRMENLQIDLKVAKLALRKLHLNDGSQDDLEEKVKEMADVRLAMDMERLAFQQEMKGLLGEQRYKRWMMRKHGRKGKGCPMHPRGRWKRGDCGGGDCPMGGRGSKHGYGKKCSQGRCSD